MLVTQVRKRETRTHVSHSQSFNSVDSFGRQKGQEKIITLSVQYIFYCVTVRKKIKNYTVLRLCIHSALLTYIVLAHYFTVSFLVIYKYK